MKSTLGVLLLVAGLCACTNQQVYDSVQNGNKLECDKLQTVQRDECLKRIGPTYDKYEEDRKKLLKKTE